MDIPSQIDCIQAKLGTYMVLAGPGSGKTYILIERIKYLISSQLLKPDEKILCLTFTNKAANAMKKKIKLELSEEIINKSLWIGTFHAFYYYILIRYSHLIPQICNYDLPDFDFQNFFLLSQKQISKDSKGLKDFRLSLLVEAGKNCQKRIKYQAFDTVNHFFWKLFDCYERNKCIQTCPQESENRYFQEMINYYFPKKMISFELMEQIAIRFLNYPNIINILSLKFPTILIDEFQDCNFYQFNIIYKMWDWAKIKNLMVVGDEKQSLYGWNGSLPNIFERFQNKTHATKKIIDFNLRNPKEILDMAFFLSGYRNEVEIKYENRDKGVVHRIKFKTDEEKYTYIINEIPKLLKDGITSKEIIILCRTNAELIKIKEKLEESSISVSDLSIKTEDLDEYDFFCLCLQFFINSTPLYLVDLNEDVKQYLSKIDLERNLLDICRQILICPDLNFTPLFKENLMKSIKIFIYENKYDSNAPKSIIHNLLTHLRLATIAEDIIENEEDKINMMTHHKGKGLEYKVVIFFDFDYDYNLKEEDKSIIFTSITRAKKIIYILRKSDS